MITIICGEDTDSSYKYWLSLRQDYIDKQYEIFNIEASNLSDINNQNSNQSLFFTKKVFFIKGLNSKINRRQKSSFNDLIKKITTDPTIDLVDYEADVSASYLKFDKSIKVKEFKPSTSIFKLLDNFYPNNFNVVYKILINLPKKIDEALVFYMIVKYIKNLILIKNNIIPSRMMSWQVAKLKLQANKWDQSKLLGLYDFLYKIDMMIKTSTNPYSIKQSLDIIISYYL